MTNKMTTQTTQTRNDKIFKLWELMHEDPIFFLQPYALYECIKRLDDLRLDRVLAQKQKERAQDGN